MKVLETTLPGVLVIEPVVHGDARGFFVETFHEERLRRLASIELPFVQDNHSRSARGVLRGLHAQLRHPQGKLARVVRGEVFDVVVDIRRHSPAFGRWFGTVLSESNHRQIWVPPGFAHGFVVLSETADFLYRCTDYYHPEDEIGIVWNDPALGIQWPVDAPLLSPKDSRLPSLAALADTLA